MPCTPRRHLNLRQILVDDDTMYPEGMLSAEADLTVNVLAAPVVTTYIDGSVDTRSLNLVRGRES
jgi:hypothetical protein